MGENKLELKEALQLITGHKKLFDETCEPYTKQEVMDLLYEEQADRRYLQQDLEKARYKAKLLQEMFEFLNGKPLEKDDRFNRYDY